jgi:hypothetical protein
MTPHYIIPKVEKKKVREIDEDSMTYDDGCGAEHGGRWTNEAICLSGRTKIRNAREHPCLHTELDRASNYSRDDLAPEHRAMWDFHVVPKLEVACELKRLGHGNISPGLEQHHRNWAAREDVSDNQFCNDVQPNLLVSDGLDHADRDSVQEC